MTPPRPCRLGALQIGSAPEGTTATLDGILALEEKIRSAELDVLVFPEALLGGYPKGADFGARVGYRVAGGRQSYLDYWYQAIDANGTEIKTLASLAKSTATALVVGAVERVGATLYCASILIDAQGERAGIHRKLAPTASERLIWGQGDGSTLTTMMTAAGRVGSAICWENYMPLLRAAMYAKQIDVWCAPTVDERDMWQVSMRHIAYEARCFVVSACQFQPAAVEAAGQVITLRDRPDGAAMIRGGSCIVSPSGNIIAGPLYGEEGLVTADVDLNDIVRARFDLDVTGHYARPDVFRLHIDTGSGADRSTHNSPQSLQPITE